MGNNNISNDKILNVTSKFQDSKDDSKFGWPNILLDFRDLTMSSLLCFESLIRVKTILTN